MQSYRSNVDNPWNLFISDKSTDTADGKHDETKLTDCQLEKFLSSSIPLSFKRSDNVVRCDLCNILVIKNRFKWHYEHRHTSDSSTIIIIPFDEHVLTENKTHKIKKIKRNRKKRSNFKEKIKYPIEFLEKKKGKKVKLRTSNKRHHSNSFLDTLAYFSTAKKLKSESSDKKSYFLNDDQFMLSSPKLLNDSFYHDNKKSASLFDTFSLNDAVYCSNGSVNRTSSDSSTPPSLSLVSLQTISSPSSLNIPNDPSSVVTEHYFLPSNDLTSDRSGVSCKYQIDSLPWENFSTITNKEEDYNGYFIVHPLPGTEDGEVERAVQSITNLCEGFQTDLVCHKQRYSATLAKNDVKGDLFNSDDASVIDCFLDEVLGGSSNKDQLMEFSSCVAANNQQQHISNQNNLLDECNNLSEYQIDSNILNHFSSDYDEKFETLINNAMNEFVTHSPQNICSANPSIDKKKSYDSFDPLKHCGVVAANGVFCHRSLLCKLHTMPQKRQVERSENITVLIKGIRDFNKTKRLHKKQAQSSNAFKYCNSSKTSSDSFNYNCSSTRSTEEASSFLDNRLSTPDLDLSILTSITDICAHQPEPISNNMFQPRPLVKSPCQQDIMVNGNRSLMAMKSLLWRNRPKSKNHGHVFRQFRSSNCHDAGVIHVSSNSATHRNISVKNINDMPQQGTYTSHYGLSSISDNVMGNIKMNPDLTINDSTIYYNTNNNGSLSDNSRRTSATDITLPPSFFSCSSNNQLLNISPHFLNTNPASSLATNIIYNDNNLSNSGYSLANNTSITMADVMTSSNNKFISILDEGSGSGSIIYPVRNNNQIMMVMNKKHRSVNDLTDLVVTDNSANNTNHQFTSMPLNSFLTLKQNSVQDTVNNHLTSPQIVSISPLELQRLTDNFHGGLGAQLLSTDCESSNPIIYQVNQTHPGNNNFVPSSMAAKVESNSVAKPLTVQSSTLNGLTQKFVILPDGTISTFTQQSNNNFSQPIFNYGPNQTYYINNDNVIMAPPSGVTNGITQQIIMPQLISQADLQSHSSSALTFMHPQQTHTSQMSTFSSNNSNLPSQIPVDSSQHKMSFQIQNQNRYSNQIPNAFFITTAPPPTVSTNMPLNQQIFVQANEELTHENISLMASSGYFDGNCNNQTISMDSLSCNSDIRTMSSSSQDFDLINHIMKPPSIIIQQPSVNRFTNTNGCPSSLDIDGAHSTLHNGQQHIVVSNTQTNEQFAQSHLKLSHRQMPSSSYVNVGPHKSGPPPLVISQQLLNQSLSNQIRQKTFSDHSYQQPQPPLQKVSQLVMDDSQFSNEYMIVQSMIA